MNDTFKIYLDSLQSDKAEIIDYTIPSSFLAIDEQELKFEDPITIKGKAYIADKDLILHLKVKYCIEMRCSICNEFTKKAIEINDLYIAKELSKISLAYNFGKDLRESLILELPAFVECNDNCKERENIKTFFKKDNDKHLPFSQLKGE